MKINKKKNNTFTFVDLFSGIGGFRIALEKYGGICKGFSEIDNNAIATYKKNFITKSNHREIELGNIEKINSLPFNVDLIVGGVPCQSWSIAGKMKGFDDPRGKLWNDTLRLVKNNTPKAFIFENVKGLADPRNKKSLDFLINEFEKLGYIVKKNVLNSYDFGVPQNRERIYIVGIRKKAISSEIEFEFPLPTSKGHKLSDLIDNLEKDTAITAKTKLPISAIHATGKIPYSRNRFQKLDELNDFFIFSDTRNGHSTIHSWDILKTSDREKKICLTVLKNRRKKIYGNSDGNSLSFNVLAELIPNLKRDELDNLVGKNILRITNDKKYEFVNSKNSSGIKGIYRIYLPRSHIFSTLTATGTKDFIALKNITGNNADDFKRNFINEIFNKKKYRPISSIEAARLQGFPNNFKVHAIERIAQKQFGNAVSVPVIESLIKAIKQTGIF
jgi:DNA (cytosine-5)-methyltransferase 1